MLNNNDRLKFTVITKCGSVVSEAQRLENLTEAEVV